MAITKVINDLIDLNQTGDYSGIRLPAGTTADRTQTFTTDYLVVAGGAGGARGYAGGGGAGGLRTSYNNSTTTTNLLSFPSGKTAIATYMLDNNATDVSQNYDGAETNITYNTGKYGSGAVFNGSSSRIQVASTATAPLNVSSGNFSISMWVNPSNLTNNNKLIYKFGTSASLRSWLATITTNGVLYVVEGTTVGDTLMLGTATIPTNTWTHIAITRAQGGNLVQYINGVATDTFSTQNRSLKTSTEPLYIGYQAGQTTNFTGLIDQVRIFASALSDSQITELYNEKPCADTSTFAATLYDGNSNSAGQYVSSVGFQPDLTWIKYINSNIRHLITDSITGPSVYQGAGITNHSNEVFTSNTYGEFTSFDTNGFIVQYWSGSQYFNTTGRNYVAWNWKAGGDAALNQNGGTNSQVSANTAAGFSIVNWSGDNSTTTIGHGLNSAPEVVIRKNLGTSNWAFDTTVIDGSFDYLFLNSSAQKANHTSLSAPTSTVFSTSGTAFNSSSMIAYCWHSVAGKSSISTYEGDGTNDNTKQITGLGFDPSFVMVKNVDSAGGNWEIIDTARGGGNNLYANESYSQNANTPASYGSGQFISGGFSVTRGSVPSSVQWNKSGDTYLYMAFK